MKKNREFDLAEPVIEGNYYRSQVSWDSLLDKAIRETVCLMG